MTDAAAGAAAPNAVAPPTLPVAIRVGLPMRLSPRLTRITAGDSGPVTGPGTCDGDGDGDGAATDRSPAVVRAAADPPPRRHRVTLLPTGWAFDVGDGESVLEAARRAGVVLPSSCRNGTCRSCRCRYVEGSVRYRVEWPGLSAEEKRDAWTLPCVALPLSDLLIDAPGASRPADAAAAAPAGGG